MHGLGNDYVYVNCFEERNLPDDLPELARRVSDRHFGIGGDGLILVRPSELGDARMQMFNADGSEAEMCGNGVRCVAKLVYDHGICRNETLKIETGAGLLAIDLEVVDGQVARAAVDMGRPILAGLEIPTTLPGNSSLEGSPVCDVPLEVDGQTLQVTCVSMGNPHCVTFVDQITDEQVLGLGPKVEQHAAFPNRINAEFVEVLSPTEMNMRVWERGSGETLACGTGACAVGVAGVLTGRTERNVTIHLLGGDLQIEWSKETGHVRMTGPATEVFSGIF